MVTTTSFSTHPRAGWLSPLVVATILFASFTNLSYAQTPPPKEGTSETTQVDPSSIAAQQAELALQYKRLEELLLKSAELESASNPTRAALLQQAAQMSKQAQLAELLARSAKSLEKGSFSQAVDDQKLSRENLKRIVELLQSENRQDRVREQRDQVKRWIEETDRVRRLQSSLRGRTEGGQSTEQAAQDQEKLARKAEELAQSVSGDKAPEASKENDDGKSQDGKSQDGKSQDGKSQDGKSQDGKSQDGKSQDGKSQDGKSQDGKSQDGKSQDGKSQDGKSQDGKSQDGKSQDGKSQDGKSQDGKSQDGKSQDGKSDGRESQQPEPKDPTERAAKRIQRAQQKMKEAQKRLEDAQREGAIEEQRQAEQELEAAIEDLEEILRQLREEEIERSLAALETRLRSMLQMQNKVLSETNRLAEIGGDKLDRQVEIRASSLSLEERRVLDEGQRALLLLREEGTSTAFPEAMQQVLADVQTVVERLAKADVGKLTISIEEEIVSSLEEMIEALAAVQKDQKKRKEQQQQPGQQQQPSPGEQPLVDQLAELRLIRTLQVRVNKRTNTLSESLSDPNDATGQAQAADVQEQIRKLGERQAQIQQVTRDIVTGKNKQ